MRRCLKEKGTPQQCNQGVDATRNFIQYARESIVDFSVDGEIEEE